MPRQLWLLRHGDAEPHGARPDAERRLTERGRRQSIAAGRALAALEVDFGAAFTSPRVRALETAELACEALGRGEPIVHQPLHAGFDRAGAEELLGGFGEDACLLLVGHEPDFSQLVRDFTGGHVDLKKGGIATLRVGASGAELVALLRPSEIELLGV